VEKYFTATFIADGALPPQMEQHLRLWLQIMLGGSRQSPRQIPRDPATVELHIRGLAPLVQAWAQDGHQSFAEITKGDILAALAALPPRTTHRHFAENGLKSLFKILKGRRLVFANPTRGLTLTPVATNIPLPLNTALIRAELNNPACPDIPPSAAAFSSCTSPTRCRPRQGSFSVGAMRARSADGGR